MFDKVSSTKKVKEVVLYEKDSVVITDEDINTSPINLKDSIDKGWVIVVDSDLLNAKGFKAFNLIGVNCNNNIWQSENKDFPHWIKWRKVVGNVLVQKYSIMNQELYGSDFREEYQEQNIKSWVLQGSDDGREWIDLDKVTLMYNPGSRGIVKREIDNDKSFIWHRLLITSNFSENDKTVCVGMIKTWCKKRG